MAKIERKYMAHFIDATFQYNGVGDTITWTPVWYRLGEDLEEYSVELNPIAEVEKNFLGDDVLIHTGYEMSAEAESFYAYIGDALSLKLQDIIDNNRDGASCLTMAIDVQLWHGGSTPGSDTYYQAVLRPCCVIPASYGGDTSGYQMPFEVRYLNNFAKTVYFTPDGNGSGSIS